MELKLPTLEQLREVYQADLIPSFPAAELKPLHAIEAMWRDGCYRPWCLFEGEEILGEAFLWLGNPGWGLLDYLCVSSGRRNSGTGGRLIRQMLEKNQDLRILGESELPETAPDPAMAQRRLGFYKRNQARTAGYDTEMFGVPYKTIYWADAPVEDAELIRQHRWIYQSRFSPEKYEKYVRIPRVPGEAPASRVPWDE